MRKKFFVDKTYKWLIIVTTIAGLIVIAGNISEIIAGEEPLWPTVIAVLCGVLMIVCPWMIHYKVKKYIESNDCNE